MIRVVIAKPTKLCNADCSYCSSPPDGVKPWGDRELQAIFSSLKGQVDAIATFIWHGGEPLLMGPDFYRRAWEISQELTPQIRFSVQSNLLLYKSSRWRSVFEEIFGGSCSTSYDPDEKQRTIKGNAETYTRTFFRKIDEVMADGFSPMVIGTFTEETAPLMHLMYEKSLGREGRAFDIRLNYCSPVGKEAGSGLLIQPETYGKSLMEIYNRWIRDVPGITVTPLDQMVRKVLGVEGDRCPWTHNCGGEFLGILPNGDTYNCGEFSDLSEHWRYGNIIEGTYRPANAPINFYRKADPSQIIDKMLGSQPAREIKRRKFQQPQDCLTCRHYRECQGGCMRDSVLYERGIGGKFMYCQSWKMVFDRIKQSILTKEADGILEMMGFDGEQARDVIRQQSDEASLMKWSPHA